MDAAPGERSILFGHPVLIEALVTRASRRQGDESVAYLRLWNIRRGRVRRDATDAVRLSCRQALSLEEGDRLKAWVTLEPVAGFANGRWPASSFSRLRGWLKSPLLIRAHDPGGATWRRVRGGMQRYALSRLQAGLRAGGASSSVRSLAAAIALGDRSGMDRAEQGRLRRAGTAHVLAVSGLHFAVLTGLLGMLLRRSGLEARLIAAGLLAGLALYTVLLPVRPSVIRAALMGAAPPLARCLGRRTQALNLLGGAGGALLLISPRLHMDPGFVLSFTVTAALLHLAIPGRRRRNSRGATRLLLASLIATGASLPLTSLFFGQASPAAVLINLLAVPAASALVIVAALATLLACIHPLLAAPLALPAKLAAAALLLSADLARWLPGGFLLLPTGRPLLVTGCLIALFLSRSTRGRIRPVALSAALVGMALVLAGIAPPHPLPRGCLSLRALDVGQGDALMVGLPHGDTILVDAGGLRGGSLDVGRRVVLPALRDAGLSRLTAVALSHAHYDHGGGLSAVLEDMPVGELWLPAIPPGNDLIARLVDRAIAAGVAIRVLHQGDVLVRDGVTIRCLGPPPWRTRSSPNQHSLILKIEGASGSFFLPGDLDGEGEELLLSHRRLTPATVLKVAHHGSKTSTGASFLQALQPELAVISVGRRNPWGHPHPQVLARLRAEKIPILRTDRQGAVTISLRPGGPSLRTEKPGEILTSRPPVP